MLRASPTRCIYQYKFGQPSLTKAFANKIAPNAVPATPGALQTTTLANGVRVVTHDLDGPHSAIGVYADAGPKYDPVATPGLSYVMRYAIQTSNMDSSLFQIDRAMRSVGFAYGHRELGKRFLAWKAEGRRDLWERPFEHLATGVVAPRFHESDVERFRDTFDNQLEELRWLQPRVYAVDQLETVAFYKEPLGSPRMVPPKANDRCSQTALLNQWASLFVPSRIVVAAVNVPHDALVAAYEKLPYAHDAAAPHFAKSARTTVDHKNEAAQFYPGRHEVQYEARAAAMGTKPDMEPEVVAAVGALAHGREEGAKPYAASLVAREVYAAAVRQATGAVPSSDYNGVEVFYRPYATTGLLGYTVRGAPSAIAGQLKAAAAAFPASVSEAALAAGKARAAARLLEEELDLTRDYVDFIATSPVPAEELSAAVRAVSKADVEGVLSKLAGQKPASFVTGDTFDFPVISALNKI